MMNSSVAGRNDDANLIDAISELSNTSVFACYQCGNCTAGCPAADYMDLMPHCVIRFIQLGQIDRVVRSNSMWICAACLTCSVRCPKGVDIAAVMEALRQIVLKEKRDIVDLSVIDREMLAKLPQIALINCLRKLTI